MPAPDTAASSIRSCSKCGAELVEGNVCPRCLFDVVLESQSTDGDDEGSWLDAFETQSAPAGSYEIIEEIARGGMGVVYRARHRGLNRIVALKMIQPQQLRSPAALQRFRSEAEAVAALDHPGILPIYEVGELDGIPFFSMKLAEGGSLAEHLGEWRQRPRDAVQLMARIARAVHHAHGRGILHRDVKPGNILLGGDGAAFVSDFGIAKWMERDSSLTLAHASLGTPFYAAPEQATGRSNQLTTATDVYSLGAILFELLAGQPPFAGESAIETLRLVVETPAPPLRGIWRDAPRDLDVICAKCLVKEPSARYASAAALAEDLERWLEGRSIHARPSTALERTWRWSRRNPVIAALLAVCLLLIFATAIGATIGAVRIASARDRAVAAERERTEELWSSYLAQARASRATGRTGQRFDSLETIEKAARIHPNIETRNAAIASLALFDVRLARSWPRLHSRYDTTAFDATLERYACEVENGAVAICRVADQHEIVRLAGPGARVEFIYAFSPDGQYVSAKLEGGETWMWRLADQRALLKLKGNPLSGGGWIAFSSGTGLFAFSLPTGGVDVYRIADLDGDNATAAKPWRHWVEPRLPQGVAFSPDGKRLAICDQAYGGRVSDERNRSGRVQLRDVETSSVLWIWPNDSGVSTACWSDDGAQLAASSWDRNVHLLDATSGRELRALHGHRDGATMAKFNHAGSRVATLGLDGQLLFADPRSGENLVSFPSGEPTFVFAPDDRHLGLTVDDQTIGLLEIADSTVFGSLRPTNNAGRPLGLAESNDGRFIVSSGFNGSVVWDLQMWTALASPGYADVRVCSAEFVERDGRTLLLIGDQISGYALNAIPGERAAAQTQPEPWLPESGWLLQGVSPDLRQAGFVPRGTAHDAVLVADIANPQNRHLFRGAQRPARVAFSADHRFVACGSSGEGGVTVWRADGELLRRLEPNEPAIAVFDPRGRWLATGSRLGYRFWRLDDWQPGPRVDYGSGRIDVAAAAFSPDGKYFAAIVPADKIVLVDAGSGAPLATLEAPFPIAPEFLLFSADSRWLTAEGVDQTLQRWDLQALIQELAKLHLDWATK